jgi:hypothetical protein
MTQGYPKPIAPPPELVQEWLKERTLLKSQPLAHHYLATRAAQWGADQELEACCEWLDREGWSGESRQLRAARRPKPQSLKEQAIAVLEDAELDAAHYNILLRALEQLPDPS